MQYKLLLCVPVFTLSFPLPLPLCVPVFTLSFPLPLPLCVPVFTLSFPPPPPPPLQIVHYYLVDNTVEVREVHEANDGRDPFPVLICRQRLPKNRNTVPGMSKLLYTCMYIVYTYVRRCVSVCLCICAFMYVCMYVCMYCVYVRRCVCLCVLCVYTSVLIPHPLASFPSCVMEYTDDEVKEWLSPKDFGIGKTVNIMGRKCLM